MKIKVKVLLYNGNKDSKEYYDDSRENLVYSAIINKDDGLDFPDYILYKGIVYTCHSFTCEESKMTEQIYHPIIQPKIFNLEMEDHEKCF